MNIVTNACWVASFPKSGNTWCLNLIKYPLERKGLTNQPINAHEVVRDKQLPQQFNFFNENLHFSNCCLLKTHRMYSEDFVMPSLKLRTSGFIYIYRNPLDVFFSYLNFTRLELDLNKTQLYRDRLFIEFLGFNNHINDDEWKTYTLDTIPNDNILHAFNYYVKNNLSIPTIYDMANSYYNNVMSWINQLKKYPSVLLRYEDMLDGPEQLLKLSSIFQINKNEIIDSYDKVNDIIVNAAKESEYSKIFYNKKQKYYYREYLTKDKIKEFKYKYRDLLEKLNYSDIPE